MIQVRTLFPFHSNRPMLALDPYHLWLHSITISLLMYSSNVLVRLRFCLLLPIAILLELVTFRSDCLVDVGELYAKRVDRCQ